MIRYADIIKKNAPYAMQRNMSGGFETSPAPTPEDQYRFKGPIADVIRQMFSKGYEMRTGKAPDMTGKTPVIDYYKNRMEKFGNRLGLQGPKGGL